MARKIPKTREGLEAALSGMLDLDRQDFRKAALPEERLRDIFNNVRDAKRYDSSFKVASTGAAVVAGLLVGLSALSGAPEMDVRLTLSAVGVLLIGLLGRSLAVNVADEKKQVAAELKSAIARKAPSNPPSKPSGTDDTPTPPPPSASNPSQAPGTPRP